MTLAWFVLHAFKIGISGFKRLLGEYADTHGGFLIESRYRTVGEKQNRFSKSSSTYGETLREHGASFDKSRYFFAIRGNRFH